MTYAVSWIIWLIGIVSIPDLTSVGDERFWWFLLAGSFAPTGCALATSALFGGREAVGNLLKRFLRFKVNWKIYLLAFFLLPTIGIATYLVMGIGYNKLWGIISTAIVFMPVNALLGGVIFGIGPVGEEMGWRGFLQERLQGRFNAIVTAVIIGLIWAVWHFPVAIVFEDFRNGISLTEFMVLYPVSTILLSYIMGHLWRWSRGSLVIAIFFHGVVNMTADYLLHSSWWDFGDLTALHIYVMILGVFALMAIATGILSRTVVPFRHAAKEKHGL